MSGERVLITGSGGMVGNSLLSILSDSYTVVGLNSTVDITDSDIIHERLSLEKPSIIIHSAAYTDVDGCEENINKAYKVNTIGTHNFVNYCIGKNILFVYLSSTGVYGEGKKEAYTEFDKVKPSTIHHKSKYEAEKIIQNHLSKYLILRTGWLYGGNKHHKRNFVYKRLLESYDNEIIYSDNSQLGNPTSINDLAAQLILLIERQQYGLFNCVNKARQISRFDYVKKIIELFDSKCSVQVGSTNMFKRRAPVSKNESAVNYKLELLGLNVMKEWDESLTEYIKQLQSEL